MIDLIKDLKILLAEFEKGCTHTHGEEPWKCPECSQAFAKVVVRCLHNRTTNHEPNEMEALAWADDIAEDAMQILTIKPVYAEWKQVIADITRKLSTVQPEIIIDVLGVLDRLGYRVLPPIGS